MGVGAFAVAGDGAAGAMAALPLVEEEAEVAAAALTAAVIPLATFGAELEAEACGGAADAAAGASWPFAGAANDAAVDVLGDAPDGCCCCC